MRDYRIARRDYEAFALGSSRPAPAPTPKDLEAEAAKVVSAALSRGRRSRWPAKPRIPIPTWRGSVLPRGRKLWLKVKGPVATCFQWAAACFSSPTRNRRRLRPAYCPERLLHGEVDVPGRGGRGAHRRDPVHPRPNPAPADRRRGPRVARQGQYTREELVSLVSATSIPENERVANALLGLGALRVGEMGGLRFRNLTLEMLPLGRIVVARSYNKRGTKTKVVRWIPIHPVLEEILREWQARGFAATMGRAPTPDDLVVPTPPKPEGKGRFSPPWQMRDKNYTRKAFLRDLRTLGIDHRRVHDLRRTFISLAREDGADKDILRRGTHQPPRDVMELYTTVEWRKLCAEVAKTDLPDRSAREGPAEGRECHQSSWCSPWCSGNRNPRIPRG
jgi:integrase